MLLLMTVLSALTYVNCFYTTGINGAETHEELPENSLRSAKLFRENSINEEVLPADLFSAEYPKTTPLRGDSLRRDSADEEFLPTGPIKGELPNEEVSKKANSPRGKIEDSDILKRYTQRDSHRHGSVGDDSLLDDPKEDPHGHGSEGDDSLRDDPREDHHRHGSKEEEDFLRNDFLGGDSSNGYNLLPEDILREDPRNPDALGEDSLSRDTRKEGYVTKNLFARIEKLSSLPNTTKVLASIREFPSRVHLCNGNYIAPNFLLTTASCLFGHTPQKLFVHSNSKFMMKGGVNLDVKAVFTHPNYEVSRDIHDIGIVQLVKNAKNVTIFKLPTPQVNSYLGRDAKVYTWMFSNERKNYYAHEFKASVISNAKCTSILRKYVEPESICAAGFKLEFGPNDLGSPLVVNVGGQKYVEGIFYRQSVTPAVVAEKYCRVFTYLDWIKTITKDNHP